MTKTLAGADALLGSQLDAIVDGVSLADAEPAEREVTSATRKKAYRDPRAGSPLARVALVRDDDVLRWIYDPPPVSLSRRRSRRALGLVDEREVVHGFQFLEVPPNEIRAKLRDLDHRLNDHHGLWSCTWAPVQAAAAGGAIHTVKRAPVSKPKELGKRVLLLIHGTFSSSDMYFEELTATPEGTALLTAASKTYDAILAFDHPTLWIPPWANALRLQAALEGYTGTIDVICHSRGGLVCAWWMYMDRTRQTNVVFVGSPLEGTSLAAPAKLKNALDLLANLARGVGTVANTAATVVPLLGAAAGLMKIVGGVLTLGARTPLLDAGVALVPGLAAQSRDETNYELKELLNSTWPSRVNMFALTSNFEPPENTDPWWKFWTRFRGAPTKLADWGADKIFGGANDLVVDTNSMNLLGNVRIKDTFDFTSIRPVHHCAYFRQPEAVREIRGWLNF